MIVTLTVTVMIMIFTFIIMINFMDLQNCSLNKPFEKSGD